MVYILSAGSLLYIYVHEVQYHLTANMISIEQGTASQALGHAPPGPFCFSCLRTLTNSLASYRVLVHWVTGLLGRPFNMWFEDLFDHFDFKYFFPTSLCEVLVFDSVSRFLLLLLLLLLRLLLLSHTIFHTPLCHPPSFTYNFVTHHLSHTSLSTTIFHTHLCQPPSFTHIFVIYHLSHTSLSTTIFHTHLCQPPTITHIFVNHHLSHTSLSTTISHTSLSTTILHTHLCQPHSTTISHAHLCQPPALTGVAHGHIHLCFTWQACHLATFTFVSRGRRGTWSRPPSFCVAGVALMALGGAFGPVLVAGDAAALCVADWHLATFTFVSCGRGGTGSHPPWFCVAGVALMALGGTLGPILVAGDAAALCLVTFSFVSRGRRGTWSHPPWFCMASVALMALGDLPSFHVAGVTLGHIHLRFAWQAWHLWHWVARLGPF